MKGVNNWKWMNTSPRRRRQRRRRRRRCWADWGRPRTQDGLIFCSLIGGCCVPTSSWRFFGRSCTRTLQSASWLQLVASSLAWKTHQLNMDSEVWRQTLRNEVAGSFSGQTTKYIALIMKYQKNVSKFHLRDFYGECLPAQQRLSLNMLEDWALVLLRKLHDIWTLE